MDSVKEYVFYNPKIKNTDEIISNCKRDFYYKYYHSNVLRLEYDIIVTN